MNQILTRSIYQARLALAGVGLVFLSACHSSDVLTLLVKGTGNGAFEASEALDCYPSDIRREDSQDCEVRLKSPEQSLTEINVLGAPRPSKKAPRVSVNAIADKNSIFVGWAGACMGANPCTVIMHRYKSASAQFTRTDYAMRKVEDAAGNTIEAGSFHGLKVLGEWTFRGNGEVDIYVVKFTPENVPLWSLAFGGKDVDQILNLHVDPTGDILLMATLRSAFEIDGEALSCNDSAHTFFVKFSGSDGSVLWKKCLAGEVGP